MIRFPSHTPLIMWSGRATSQRRAADKYASLRYTFVDFRTWSSAPMCAYFTVLGEAVIYRVSETMNGTYTVTAIGVLGIEELHAIAISVANS